MKTEIIQMLTAFIGALGFAFLFNVGRKNLFFASFGGFLSWAVYLLCVKFNLNIFVASVITAAFCEIYAEIMARKLKAPTTVFYIPAVVPLIPGSSLYYTMYHAVSGNWEFFGSYGFQTLQFTLGIAAGTSFVSAIIIIAKKLLLRKVI